MALPNAIGLSDSVKTFTAPANLAPVHSAGDTWARQGRTDADTSRIGVAEWNYMIGSFRGVINFTPGFDPSARDVDDPTLLRDAITAFSTAKIIELLPDAVLDQAPALAAEMAGIPAFVAAVVGAVPTNLNPANILAGTIGTAIAFSVSPTVPNVTFGDNSTKAANTAYVQAAIAALINSAPGVLDTIGEIATALGNDPNAITTIISSLAGKVGTGRLVSTSGLATGGGSLAADLTINVPKASNAEAIAGVDDTKAMTPIRVKDSVIQFAPAPDYGAGNAALAYGAVGTYVFAYRFTGTVFTEGSTYAGSVLEPAGITNITDIADDDSASTSTTKGAAALSGTWRAMGRVGSESGTNRGRATLFLRIS